MAIRVSVQAVPSVGLPRNMWLVETNTGVASMCRKPGGCATTFSGPNGLAASFNRSMWYAKGDVMSTEMRAYSNYNWHRAKGLYYLIGFTGFGPNLNIVRCGCCVDTALFVSSPRHRRCLAVAWGVRNATRGSDGTPSCRAKILSSPGSTGRRWCAECSKWTTTASSRCCPL